MMENLAVLATGNKEAFVYYIEDNGPEYKLLEPQVDIMPSITYLGDTEGVAEMALWAMIAQAIQTAAAEAEIVGAADPEDIDTSGRGMDRYGSLS